MKKGSLYLVPATLGDNPAGEVIPAGVLSTMKRLEVFIVENIRTARRYLRKAGYDKDFDSVKFFILDKKTDPSELDSFLNPALQGRETGLISEAGLPAVADPGADIVSLAHQKGIKVVPLTGPSSILLALMASGFSGQSFCFHGYLPIQKNQREKKIAELEKQSAQQDQTQIFIETPYRNLQMLESLIKTCHPSTKICVACDLTTETELIISKSAAEWKAKLPDIHKRPAVFLLSKK